MQNGSIGFLQVLAIVYVCFLSLLAVVIIGVLSSAAWLLQQLRCFGRNLSAKIGWKRAVEALS